MFCLTCNQDDPGLGPACGHCGARLGLVAEGRGYLPQLESLKEEVQAGRLDPEEADRRLDTLARILQSMVAGMDQSGAALVGLELSDVQQGVLSGFLAPVREGLLEFLEALSEFDPAHADGALLSLLEEAQLKIGRGNEGVAFLARTVAGIPSPDQA